MTQLLHPGTDEVLGDLKIVDCDAHITEPADLWTSRVPASLRAMVPRHRTVDGVTTWFINDESWATIGGNTINRDDKKILGTVSLQPFDTVSPSAWDTQSRLNMLDKQGILHKSYTRMVSDFHPITFSPSKTKSNGKWFFKSSMTFLSTCRLSPWDACSHKRCSRSGTWT